MANVDPARELPPIWRLGFRPFFLFASVFAVISIGFWLVLFTRSFELNVYNPVLWHAHEMIYGYATAVIAGFILTASQNWTGLPGIRGKRLIVLFLIWSLGRILMSLPQQHHILVSLVDLSFYPALALAMYPYLKPADMKTERVFFVYFALYFAGNLMMHLEILGWIVGYGLLGARVGLNTTILMIVFMGGRVIPFFSESELAKTQPRVREPIEILSHVSAWAFLVTQLVLPYSKVSALVAILAGGIHFIRLSGWYVRRVRRVALLWVLYSSYFWIALGFILSGLSSLLLIPSGSAVHALTIGGLGIITYGMMTRVSLGHTGRKLSASRAIIVGYVLLNLSCFVRVFGVLTKAQDLEAWILLSGTLWIIAFMLMLYIYTPMLMRPRVDHRPE